MIVTTVSGQGALWLFISSYPAQARGLIVMLYADFLLELDELKMKTVELHRDYHLFQDEE